MRIRMLSVKNIVIPEVIPAMLVILRWLGELGVVVNFVVFVDAEGMVTMRFSTPSSNLH